MNIRRAPIKSGPSATDPRIWLDLQADQATGRCSVLSGNHLGKPVPPRELNIAAASALARAAAAAGGKRTEHVLALLLDGSIVFLPSDQLPQVLLAHLGVYRPWLDELELLEFVDDRI